MTNPMKSVSLFGTILLHYTVIIVTCFPYWRSSTSKLSDGIYRVWKAWEGIWWRCTAKKAGEMWCDFHKDPLFKLSGQLHSMRTLMCFACFFSFIAVILCMLSMECITAVKEDTKKKAMMSLGAAVLVLTSGSFMALATSWYAADVYHEFLSPYYKNREVGFEFGPCLFIGWGGSLLALICGLLMLSVGCKELNGLKDDEPSSYRYQPPTSSNHRTEMYASNELKAEYV